jgi:hypothetical protein
MLLLTLRAPDDIPAQRPARSRDDRGDAPPCPTAAPTIITCEPVSISFRRLPVFGGHASYQLAELADSLASRGHNPNGNSLWIVWKHPPELEIFPRLAYRSRMPITLFFGIVGSERTDTPV